MADADIEGGLAEATIFVALALPFGHFALRATAFGLAGSGGHMSNGSAGRVGEECAVGNIGWFAPAAKAVQFSETDGTTEDVPFPISGAVQ